MATTVRDLLVKLGVKADDQALKRFDAGLSTVRRGMFAAAVGAVALAGGLFAVAQATANQGDEAAKAAQRVGITAEEMQELGFAAEQSGARLVDMEVAFRRQAVSARDAAKGTGLAVDAYKKIGVEVKDSNGQLKGQLQLFTESAEGISKLATETDKMAIANDLFGRGGAKLIPLLNQGAAGIEELRKQARDLGFVMGKEATDAAEDFNDRMNEARKILAGVRNQIGVALMPVVTNLIARFRDWFIANRDIIDQRIDTVVEGITDTVDKLTEAFERVDEAVKEGPGSWGVVFRQVGKVLGAAGLTRVLLALLPAIKAIGVGITAAFSLVLANPVVLVFVGIAAAIVGVLLVLEDFIVFLRGGNSAIGRFLDTFDRSGPVLEKWGRVVEAVSDFAAALGERVGDMTDQISNSFARFARAIDLANLWEAALIALDAVAVGFILGFESGLMSLADNIELATVALEDFDAFLAEVFGRLEDFFSLQSTNLVVGVAGQIGPSARRAAERADIVGGIGGAFGALSERFGPRPTLQGGGAMTTVNQEGDTVTIQTVADPEAIAETLARRARARRLAAFNAARGGDR